MSPMIQTQFAHTISFPRMSGDEPGGGVWRRTRDWFSPHERG